MKLFTVGPVEMYERTLKLRSKQIPYFRCNEFSLLMFEIEEKLKKIVKTQDSSRAAFITGSGSAAMESVISSTLTAKSHVLVINGGTFGNRFATLMKQYNINYKEIKLEFGEILNEKHFSKFEEIEFSDLFVNIHETSIGQLYDIKLISSFCARKRIKLVVDAISSFLCEELNMDEYNIDCLILSSQKALALAPGLSMVIVNQTYYEQIKDLKSKTLYLNLQEHFLNMERGQTPNTPAVGICYELHDMLNYLEEKGLENILCEIQKKATKFREQIQKLGLKIPEYPLSNCLTPIIFESNAYEVYEYLKDNYDIHVTPSGGELKNTLIRVGHIGNILDSSYDELIMRIKEVLK